MSKRDRTRDALLVAIQELLLEGSADSVSVPRVVARTGVAQGTFYNYFDTLPQAIECVGDLVLTEHVGTLAQVIDGVTDPVEVIARTAKQTLMLFTRHPDVGRLLFDSGFPVDRFLIGVRLHLAHDLAQGIESGALSLNHLSVTESVYAGAMLGACIDMYRGRRTVDDIPTIVNALLRILNVSARRADRLALLPQEFVAWRSLPLSALEGRQS